MCYASFHKIVLILITLVGYPVTLQVGRCSGIDEQLYNICRLILKTRAIFSLYISKE